MVKKIDLKKFDRLSAEEQYKILGIRGIPKSAWKKRVRDLTAVELVRLHREEVI